MHAQVRSWETSLHVFSQYSAHSAEDRPQSQVTGQVGTEKRMDGSDHLHTVIKLYRWETLTWLLNKHWEKAERHLDRLLKTLVADLTWFGRFPRDAVHYVSEHRQGLLYHCFHWKTMVRKQLEWQSVKRGVSINKQNRPRATKNNRKSKKYWLLFRSGCRGVMFTVPLKIRYSRVSAAIRLAWLLERVCHCCSFSGKFGHGSSSMLDKALHTNMWACIRRHMHTNIHRAITLCTDFKNAKIIFFKNSNTFDCHACVMFYLKRNFGLNMKKDRNCQIIHVINY